MFGKDIGLKNDSLLATDEDSGSGDGGAPGSLIKKFFHPSIMFRAAPKDYFRDPFVS